MKKTTFILLFISSLMYGQQDPHNKYYAFFDFIVTDGLVFTGNGPLAGNHNAASRQPNVVGVIQSSTGTTPSGIAGAMSYESSCLLGGGSWVYELSMVDLGDLSSGIGEYALLFGFLDINNSVDQVDGVYFLYDLIGASSGSVASDKWQCVTSSNSSRTFFETATTVVDAATKFRIEINADATNVDFYINDSPIRSQTTNIPAGSANRSMGFGWLLVKSYGSVPSTVDIDYLEIMQRYVITK